MPSASPRNFLVSASLLRDKVPDIAVYPFTIPAIRTFDTLQFSQPVTFFIGENGTGKSTLLEAIAVASRMNAEGGTESFRFDTHSSHSDLHAYLRLSRSTRRIQNRFFLRAESYFNLASNIQELDKPQPGYNPAKYIIDSYGGRSLHAQSHGESFFALFQHRFGPNGFYLLDEPEAALSPMRQMAFLTRLHDLIQQGSQFIIATHSPILMAYPFSKIFVFDDNFITEKNYRETDHYRITKDFVNKTHSMLKLLADMKSNID